MDDNYASDRSYFDSGFSHPALSRELDGRVQYEVQSVMTRLRVSSIDDQFVDECKKTLQTKLADDIKTLKSLAAAADRRSVEDLENEADDEAEENNGPRFGPMKSHREQLMYGPLERIFEHIARSPWLVGQGAEPFDRVFRRQRATLTPNQYHTLVFPRFVPDFSLLRDCSLFQLPRARQRRWCDRDGFVQVKPSNKQHVYPTDPGGPASRLLTRVADYARLHLSARPFAVFSISLLIFGCGFCVCIIDRQGVLVSPRYHMWDDLDVFIRVVRSLTRVLDEHEVGLDPSVSPAPHSMSPDGTEAYIVDPVGSDPRRWCTVREPIWSSLSLFGRGTTVWRVREVNASGQLCGPEMIMKTSWRSSDWDAESFVYHAIKGSHPGLAKYVDGGDVRFPDNKHICISAYALRNATPPSDSEDAILHRIIYATIGRPVWEYRSERELLEGFIAALEAHQFLAKQNILHRDISAGNILLAEDSSKQGSAGFLTDLDLAWLEPDVEVKITETVSPPTGYGTIPSHLRGISTRTIIKYSSRRGGQISGTLQFMSVRLLNAISSDNRSTSSTIEDDLESFLWVLVYAVYRRVRSRIPRNCGSEESKHLVDAFRTAFGGRTIGEIIRARKSTSAIEHLAGSSFVIQNTSEFLRSLLAQYNAVMYFRRQFYSTGVYYQLQPSPAVLVSEGDAFTHEGMLNALRNVLAQLRDHPELDHSFDESP
ncbi:hypothetical protein ONZ51_g1659 [Trametes cubensis]|uniref:Protein kinase domain-containing protein n=1 Tax=Trametes cubensis TaxID=1111947 RepID=A0AAD7U150_9APHY|nr:hypothetical protein ONZ51_g1659 [Trametes cubensis]